MLAGGRFCSPAAGRYSPTEGEGLAVAVALEQSKFYTLGCEQLYIATDHKPLVGIMNQQNLNTTENPRPQRIKERTMWWKFELIYTPGDSQKGADVISRSKSPVTLNNHDNSPDNEQTPYAINFLWLSQSQSPTHVAPVSLNPITTVTWEDKETKTRNE